MKLSKLNSALPDYFLDRFGITKNQEEKKILIIKQFLTSIFHASNKYRKFTYRNTKYLENQVYKLMKVFDRFSRTH